MSSPAKAHEPTMEEILASIRRIISDDDAPPKSGGSQKHDAAVVPLTDSAGEKDDADAMRAEIDEPGLAAEAAPSRPAPDIKPAFEDDLDILELTEEIERAAPPPVPPVAIAPQPKPSFIPPPPQPARPQPAADGQQRDALLSAAADKQVTEAFGSLANTILAGNAKTLDDIVRDMLRPMLRAWLDDNLPPLVERLVRQEIERVARGGR